MKEAILYEKKKDDYVRCTCCRRYCLISSGFSGFCGVRQNIDGKLFLRVYGKAIAVHVDPVEKKPLYHFLPGERVFSFGTVGCNFRCKFCQNWDISQATANVKERYKNNKAEGEVILGEICNEGQDLSPKKIVEYCLEEKIPIIAYTYNEPAVFGEYAGDTAKIAKKHGIKNVFVSNGYESDEFIDYMSDWCDAINIDIKAFNEKFYGEVCEATLSGVLKTVKKVYETGIWLECTTLVIPGVNDKEDELKGLAEFISGVSVDIPWHVTAFHPDYKMTDKRASDSHDLEKVWKIGKEAGLKYVYTGNIPGMDHNNTVCSNCGELLVERYGMECLECNIKVSKNYGKCPKCGEKIFGIWKGI